MVMMKISWKISYLLSSIVIIIWDMPFQLPFYGKFLILIAASWIALVVLITRGIDEINKLNSQNQNSTEVAA